ncbi:MAG TPA: leucine--tRNA ligase [Acidobacteriota bacterium]|nr:leucine--tRNA ligase [Acidobacteriota bacterium]
MTDAYSFEEIERRWQHRWERDGLFVAQDDPSRKKYYLLIEFPYPSGEGLHVGHPRSYTALDVVARKRRMEGFNVLYPIGWDAFGLPTENFALKTGQHPRDVTARNIERFRRQLKRLGFSFDWTREINTSDPAYYKWTQWIFLKMWEHGLAYKAEMPVNWCESCRVGLANEEAEGGVCERCGGTVVRRLRSQWMLRITRYAERLLQDLETVDYLDKIKAQQANWIGRSTGAELDFPVAEFPGKAIRVFTTRPDTVFGATYMVLAPEHALVDELLPRAENPDEIRRYRAEAARKSDLERTELVREVSGVPLQGIHARNPATGELIPIWIADYVLVSYGTGAIMAVPAHDERDWRFARKYGLPIMEVVRGGNIEEAAYTDIESGILVNSGPLNGLRPVDAIRRIIEIAEKQGWGRFSVQYRLRDWVFSRQRYWGEPIPMVHCSECDWVPLPEEELPLVLPDIQAYRTTETGESPLALLEDWVRTRCPRCGGPARRETDTMPQWAGSSWYYLRYVDPHNDRAPADRAKLEYWTPVDWYNGGMEHTTLHLLYSRFWHKFLYDIGVVPTPEPYQKRTSHGLILGEDGAKMSKSRGNVVNPDEMVERYGADAFRLYEMFMGPFDQAIPWSTQGLIGMSRFLNRVWDLQHRVDDGTAEVPEITRLIHQTIRRVEERIEALKFNTAVAALMTLVNALGDQPTIRRTDWETFLLLLSPFAPHLAEELWSRLGHGKCISNHPWPQFDPELAVDPEVEIPIQVDGKVRGRVRVPADISDDELRGAASREAARYLEGKQIRKVIVVRKGERNLISFVTT